VAWSVADAVVGVAPAVPEACTAAGHVRAAASSQHGVEASPSRLATRRPPPGPHHVAAAADDGFTYLPGVLRGAAFARAPGRPVARGHLVAASAVSGGDGSIDRPWTLQEALNQPAALEPGDTVWLRGGTYSATNLVDPSLGRISYLCNTRGSPGAPIVFRNYPHERAVIDGEDNMLGRFVQNCSHTWFWGLEVVSSAPDRSPSRAYIYVTAPDVKFINMILHDMADGIDLWTTARNAELYGSIIYHNGWDETNGGHGHWIYA
jgi:hypothetical protein